MNNTPMPLAIDRQAILRRPPVVGRSLACVQPSAVRPAAPQPSPAPAPLDWPVRFTAAHVDVSLRAEITAGYAALSADEKTALWFQNCDTNLTEGLHFQLAQGFDPTCRDAHNRNGAERALDKKHADALTVLLAAGADAEGMTATDGKPGASALLYRHASLGNVATVTTLLRAGANPNAVNADGEPVLAAACRSTDGSHARTVEELVYRRTDAGRLLKAAERPPRFPVENIKKLLESPTLRIPMVGAAGTRATLVNPEASSRLYECARTGAVEQAYALLQAGLNPNSRHADGETPLGAATRSTDKGAADVAALLIFHGADPNIQRDSDKQTPLHNAIKRLDYNMVNWLLKLATIRIHMVDKTNVTAFEQARCHAGSTVTADAIRAYLQEYHQANTHPQANAWAAAAQAGKLDTMKAMYAKHGQGIVDCVGRNSHTALWFAADYGRTDVVNQLLAWGADPGHHNGDGRTALWKAKNSCADEVVALLKAHPST